MSSAKFVHIARLMTTYNFEFEQVPDNLKCAQCKLVLKDACLLPCGCTFCRVCIDYIIASGVELCPGNSDDCAETPLSTSVPEYRANMSVLRLTAKCAHDGCVHKCELANMEEHLRECQRKSEECPFRELGCTQDKLVAEMMSGHLQHENRRHSELLIETIANINRKIVMLKQRDEDRGREIDMLKHELVLKNEQIRSIMDRLIHVENENKSIAQEKADLADRVTILSEKLESEIDERGENDELVSARVIGHVDTKIAAVTGVIRANTNEWDLQINSVKDDIESINQVAQSTIDNICSMKLQLEWTQEVLGKVDAECDWVIDSDVEKSRWYTNNSLSDNFTGKVQLYNYRLASNNHHKYVDALTLWLRIYVGLNDGQLAWPFEGRVILTVADRDKREACMRISRQCRIDKPSDINCKRSDTFVFRHSELKGAGLDLSHGVRVSCVIGTVLFSIASHDGKPDSPCSINYEVNDDSNL